MIVFLTQKKKKTKQNKKQKQKQKLQNCRFHFNGILVMLIIGLLGKLGFTHNNLV